MPPSERLAAALLAVFALTCTVAGFTQNVTTGLYSLAGACLVVAVLVGWEG